VDVMAGSEFLGSRRHFLELAKGRDVSKKTVDILEGTGFQLPLSGLILIEISVSSTKYY